MSLQQHDWTTSFHVLSRAGIELGSLTALATSCTSIAKVCPSQGEPALLKTSLGLLLKTCLGLFAEDLFGLVAEDLLVFRKAMSSSTRWLNKDVSFFPFVAIALITSVSAEGIGNVIHMKEGKNCLSALQTATSIPSGLSLPSTFVVRHSVDVSSIPFSSGILTNAS